MNRVTAPISLAGSELCESRHVCAFFKSREDEYDVTLPFIRDGFECGDKAIHIVDPSRRADHLERMAAFGLDTLSPRQSGQFELYEWGDYFFPKGSFDPDRQLALLVEALESDRQEGFRRARYVAHPEWALEDGGGVELLLEFEAGVSRVWPRCSDAVICSYDLTRFGADTLIDVLRTHPMVIIGGILQRNPFFVAPDEFLREMRERRARRTVVRSTEVSHERVLRS